MAHGSLVVRGLVAAHDVERLTDAVDRAFEAFDRCVREGNAEDGWFSPFPGRDDAIGLMRAWLRTKGGVLTADSPCATAEVADVFKSYSLPTFAEEYLGQPPILALDKWTLRRGRAQEGIEWHQDGAFLGSGVRAVNIWLALSECGEDAPSLDVIPRRLDEIVPTGANGASYGWSVDDDTATRLAGAEGWVRCALHRAMRLSLTTSSCTELVQALV